MAPERQLVLELVLPHVTDVKTMVACTLVSTEVKDHTQRAVKDTLPALIRACPYNSSSDSRFHAFLWLRGVAGDAWSSFEAGCALMGKVIDNTSSDAAEFLVATGLQLTPGLLMHLMRQRSSSHPSLLAMHLDHKGAAANMPTVYMEAATWGWCWTNGVVWRRSQPKPVDYLVARVKPAQVPDVLLLLVLQAANERTAADAALALIQRDKEVLHVLHHGRRVGSSSQDGGAAGSSSQQGSSSSVPRWLVKWWQVSSKDTQKKQQQQPQLTEQQALELVEEMLAVCVAYNMPGLCQAVAALPAAKHIGAAKVSQLLYVAYMQLNAKPHYAGPSTRVLEALTALPGAAEVPPDCFAHLLRMCVLKKDASKLEAVLNLPCVKQLSSRQLCQHIYTAGKAGFKELAAKLCGLAGGRSLHREDVLELCRRLIQHPWDFGYDSITRCLQVIEVPLRPGQILTGDDVLSLMELCVGCSSYREGWDGLLVMAKWAPAAGAVADVPRFVGVAQSATTCWHPGSGQGFITELLSAMPVSKQLQPPDWIQIALSVLGQRAGDGFLKWALQQQPELQQMGVSDLTRLLAVAAKRTRSSAAAVLAALPAAQQLDSAGVTELLMTAAKKIQGEQIIRALKGLPAVQQLGPDVLADALKTAVQHRGPAAAAALSELPAAQQLEPPVVAELLHTATQQGAASVRVILALPAARELQPAVLAQALHTVLGKMCGKPGRSCLTSEGVDAFTRLCALPQAQQLAGESVQQLFDAATDMGSDGKQLLASLCKLPQAAGMQAQLSIGRLLPLLTQAVAASNSFNRSADKDENLRQLLQEPAAQELGGTDLVELLKMAAELHNDTAVLDLQQLPGFRQLDSTAAWELARWMLEHSRPHGACYLGAFVSHPAAATFTVKQLTELVTRGVQEAWGGPKQYQQLMELPCAQQLDAAACEELMRACFKRRFGFVLDVLLQQPGARAIDADGAMRLIDAAMVQDCSNVVSGLYSRAGLTSAIVRGLPAVRRLTGEQLMTLFWTAMELGWDRVREALAEAPVVAEAAGEGGATFVAMCAAAELLKDRRYPDADD